MTILDVQYQKEFEITRVKSCISNLHWYVENGYKVSLPKNITEKSSEEEITISVENDYSAELYLHFIQELEIEWNKFSSTFEKVKMEAAISFSDKYTVLLTRYGTGGSYDASLNKIIVKIEGRTVSSVLGTLLHEMVHIAIQNYIQQNDVAHWKKERLVDLILEHYFPGKRPMQDITENVADVDKAFKEHFPDVGKITEIVGSKKF